VLALPAGSRARAAGFLPGAILVMAGSMPLPALLAPHDADGVAPCLPLEGNVIFLREANELRRWAMDGVEVTERLKRWGQHNGGRIFGSAA